MHKITKLAFFAFIFSLLAYNCNAAIDLTLADEMYKTEKLSECETELLAQLEKATTPSEKSEVYWRLSRIQVIKGEGSSSSKEVLAAIYAKGKDYADKAIAANPKNANGYMWHSANTGRASQLKGLSEQMKVVSIVTEDMKTIMDQLGVLNISEAWQAMSELYYKHPFKSTDVAVHYGRKAMMCIPKDESRFSSYAYFAELLYHRNNSASRRKSDIDSEVAEFKKNYTSNLEKFEHFEGSLGSSYVPVWSTKNLGSMSDREEAVAIVNYALKLYGQKSTKTSRDMADYKVLVGYKNSWK